jgi:FLVCR family feline leukemia virus subgroup C receptor-related protein
MDHTKRLLHDHEDPKSNIPTSFVVYRKRWLMLGLFSALSFTNALQWITFAPISDVIIKYYGVSSFAVNAMSLVFMIVYIPFIAPASWIIDSKSLQIVIYLFFSIYLFLGSDLRCIGKINSV